MMKYQRLLIGLILSFLFTNQTFAQPTWSDNVACIMYTRCTSCHNPTGIAPFSLVSYADAYGASIGILDAVSSNRMPPWPPDPGYRSFAHERSLSAAEKQTIVDWVTNGAPSGNLSNAPVPPVYTSNEVIQNPDLVISMPNYVIPPITQDLYRSFAMPTNSTVDQFITAFEVVPGNRQVVHHVLVYQDTSDIALQLDSLDPLPGFNSFGGIGSPSAKLIGAWVPGAEPVFYPAGMGIKLLAGANIIFQLHYPVGTSFQSDSTKVNFQLSSNPSTRTVSVVPIINHSTSLLNGPLFIPADSVKQFNALVNIPIPITVIGISPHMHLIGNSVLSYAVTPQQDTINLINIPSWDFHWQGTYQFRQPVKIPAFSQLKAEAVYDNTVNNPFNPNIPPQDVSLGEATTDEMFLIYFYYLNYQNGDENIVVDTSTAFPGFNGCNFITSVDENGLLSVPELNFNVYTNHQSLVVDINADELVEYAIWNNLGQCVSAFSARGDVIQDIGFLNQGVYFLTARTDKEIKKRGFWVSQ